MKSVISQSHVSKLDQKKYSEFSYCYAGLGVGSFTKEAIDKLFRRALQRKPSFHGNMNSSFYVDSIAKILAARSDNGVTAEGMMSQNHVMSSLQNLFSFHFF